MKNIRIAIIGVGNIGSFHAENISKGKVNNLTLCALCDNNENVRKTLAEKYRDIPVYAEYKKLFEKEKPDAVIICVPHYHHPKIAVCAFENGINVLTEKPSGVYTKQVREMNDAAQKSGKVFAIMFNQRTNSLFAKAKEIVNGGQLGEIKRFVWIITNWYRTQYYYNSGGWRGSYGGEGGGVLINQAPHNLDIMQWILGMPKSVTASLGIGKHHNISVEDEANLFLTYENGATATFLTSTGEPVGTNRIEITGSKGKVVIEDGKLKWWKLKEDERAFCFSKNVGFYNAPFEYEEIAQNEKETAHIGILQNFTNAILFGEKLLSPGYDGLNELILSNAAYLSYWKSQTVNLPFDEEEFHSLLKQKANDYNGKKQSNKNKTDDPTNRWLVRW